MAYTKLDGGITESTIWRAPDTTLRVWIAMLARADQNGYVGASVPGLADLSRVSLDACIEALALLEAPDKWSRTKDFEGRRIAPADGGWVLLNHAKYRAAQNADDRRERSRVAMAALRNKRKQLPTVNVGDQSYKKLSQAEAAPATTTEEESASALSPTPARIANDVPPPPENARALSQDEIEPKTPAAPTPAETLTSAIFAALMRIGIRGLVVGDPVLSALVQQGATEAEIVGVAQHGAFTGRGNWGWVSAAVAGKRSDAARLGVGPPPMNGSVAPAPAVWKPPPDPPPETPEQHEQRQQLLADAKMAALRAIQAKRNPAESPPENGS